MKAILNITTGNSKGEESKYKSNLGIITTKIEGKSNGSITVDAFKGQGENFTRREDANITIFFGGKLEFEGTLTELIKKIKI